MKNQIRGVYYENNGSSVQDRGFFEEKLQAREMIERLENLFTIIFELRMLLQKTKKHAEAGA